jgi:protein-tyrosine phosphatase
MFTDLNASAIIRKSLTFVFAVQDFLDSLPDATAVQQAATELRMVVTNASPTSQRIEGSVANVRAAMSECELDDEFKVFLQKRKSSSARIKSKFELAHRVIPNLFVGGWTALRDNCAALRALNVTHVLGLGTFTPRILPEFIVDYKVVNVEDNNEANIQKHFIEFIEFIGRCLDSHGVCYVHCGAGISRAPTACAAFLVHKFRMTAKDAILVLKRARPGVRPNAGFVRQLEVWHKTTIKEKGPTAPKEKGVEGHMEGHMEGHEGLAQEEILGPASAQDMLEGKRSVTRPAATSTSTTCTATTTTATTSTAVSTKGPCKKPALRGGSALRSHIARQRKLKKQPPAAPI